MEEQELSHILIILAGLLRAVGIACMIALIFLGAPLRYIFLIALLTVGGIFTAVLSFLLGILSFTHAVIYEVVVIFINLLVFFYAYREKKNLPPPKPSETTRCVVCSAYIKPNQEYFVLKCGENYLYFDTEEHLKRFFLENIEEYKKFRNLQIKEPECYYIHSRKLWVDLKQEEVSVSKPS
ncbi:MAG: hypothetical protein LM570_04135 [Thermocrinis sp.]|nr:hypothetical protein [Thermocrinis sp.]